MTPGREREQRGKRISFGTQGFEGDSVPTRHKALHYRFTVQLRRAVSSAPYSPAVEGARRNTHRVAGPTRPQPATATLAASSVATECYETDPTGVATARLARECVRSCGSLSAAPQRLK